MHAATYLSTILTIATLAACDTGPEAFELDVLTVGKFDDLDGKRLSLRHNLIAEPFRGELPADAYEAEVLAHTDTKVAVDGTIWQLPSSTHAGGECSDDSSCGAGDFCMWGTCWTSRYDDRAIVGIALEPTDRATLGFVARASYLVDKIHQQQLISCSSGNLLTAADIDFYDEEVIINGVGHSFAECGLSIPRTAEAYGTLTLDVFPVPTGQPGRYTFAGFEIEVR